MSKTRLKKRKAEGRSWKTSLAQPRFRLHMRLLILCISSISKRMTRNRRNIDCHPCYCELVAFLGEGSKALVLSKKLSVRSDTLDGKSSLIYEVADFVMSEQ